MKHIHKTILFILIVALLCSIITPAVYAVSGELPTLIYLAADFEGQKEGEAPWGFYSGYGDEGLFTVSTKPVEGNDSNKAMRLNGTNLQDRAIVHSAEFHPISHNFVIGLDVNFTNPSRSNKMRFQKDSTYTGCVAHGRYHTEFTFLEFSETLKVAGSAVKGVKFEKDKWYRLDFVVRVKDLKVDVYLNGELKAQSMKLPDMESVCGFEFESASAGGDYFVDNIKIYKGGALMAEDAFNSSLNEWKESALYPNEKYQNSRLYAYDKIVYHTIKGKTLGKIESKQMWIDNKVVTLSAPIRETDNGFSVPVRSFCDVFGAVTEWDDALNKATVTYDGRKIEYTVGSDVYYENGRLQKMTEIGEVKDGVLYLPLSLISHFIEINYYVDDQLISFGEKLAMDPELDPDRYFSCHTWTNKEEIFWRISCLLTQETPDAEQLLEDFYKKNPEGKHPRVETDSFEWIKEGVKTDPAFAKVVDTVVETGKKELDSELVEFRQTDYTSTSIGTMCGKMRKLAFTYVMTKEEKYKEKLVEQMKLIYDTGDFTQGQYLGIGTAGWYLGNTYDWMYDYLSEEERVMLEEIILKVLSGADKGLRAPYYINGSNHLGMGHNWNMVISNGWLSCTAALMDKHPELCSEITEGLIRSTSGLLEAYAPYGVCLEGISYWLYTCDSMVPYFNTLNSTFGTDYGAIEAPGILKMFDYARSVEGATAGFNLGDASPQSPTHAVLLHIGKETGNNELINYRKKSAGGANDLFSWVFNTGDGVLGNASSDLDVYFGNDSSITMRTGWTKTDTVVYFHGGANDDTHGHRDIGNVLFDMNGERWGDELPKEEYGLSTTHKENEGYTGGYFRNEGEGHNVVIANLSLENTYGMDKMAKANIETCSFGDIESFAIMDLTEGNPLYEYGIRGVKLNKLTNELLIQDDYKSKVPTHFWWFMNFKNTEIEVSEDGKSAILSKNNKKIVATIISDGDEKFQILEAKPLEHLTHLKAPYESPNEGYLRLGINNPNTDHFSISVVFRPYDENGTNEIISDSAYMSAWQAITAERAKLSSVTVDGVPLDSFNPETYAYDIELMTEKDPVPKIEVQASAGLEVSINEATTVPGITTVKLTKDSALVGMYNFGISSLNDTRLFLNDKQIPIKSFSVTSEPETQNPGKNLFDGSKDTKYATNENGGAVTIDFGKIQKVDEVKMAFTNGAIRKEFFTIEYSTDGINWQLAYDGASNGETTDHQSFDVGLIDAQYLRVKFFGNSNASSWVSVSELCAFTQ